MTALALVVALVVSAEDAPPAATTSTTVSTGQRWSVVGGRTVGANGNVIEAGLGWPGLSVGYSRGVLDSLDLGVRLSFNYGLEGLVTRVLPGAKVQGVLKFRLLDKNALSLALTFEPGPLFAVDRFGNGTVAFSLPVGLKMGLAVSSALTLGFTFEMPLWIQFGAGGGANLPLLPGLGLEYFIKSELLVFFRTRMGPTLRPGGFFELTFDAQLGVGYRF
ncbi:MAG: hypothetical protein MUC96_30550 [Myxococcaceae bacterium]|jgi:hypothetical protein|nr:hypothetical protein [Myxococcaceae bacterium]